MRSYDFQLNTTQSVIVGTDRDEVLDKIQRRFELILSIRQVKKRRHQGCRLRYSTSIEKIAKACFN